MWMNAPNQDGSYLQELQEWEQGQGWEQGQPSQLVSQAQRASQRVLWVSGCYFSTRFETLLRLGFPNFRAFALISVEFIIGNIFN